MKTVYLNSPKQLKKKIDMAFFEKLKELFAKCHNMKSFNRNPAFELLRIYSIFLILLRHLKAFSYPVEKQDPAYNSIMFIDSLTEVCDNEFIFISGYFSCLQNLKITRLFPVILQNLFYSVSGSIYALSKHLVHFDTKFLLKTIFPITFDVFWYTGPFIISQIFFSPIYKGLYQLGKKYHILLIAIVAYSATIGCRGYGYSITQWSNGTNINIFIYCLLIGSYLRFYDVKLNSFLSLAGIITFSFLHYFGAVITGIRLIFAPLPIIASVFIFLFFKNLKIDKNSIIGKAINFLSDYNFGVYMATMHQTLIPYTFGKIRKEVFEKHRLENILWLYLIRDSIKQYIIGIIIEIIRSFLFNYFIFSRDYYKKFCQKIDTFMENTSYPTQVATQLNNQTSINQQQENNNTIIPISNQDIEIINNTVPDENEEEELNNMTEQVLQ